MSWAADESSPKAARRLCARARSPTPILGQHRPWQADGNALMDCMVRRARVLERAELRLLDIGILHGKIVALAPDLRADAPSIDAEGMLVVPGLIETHIHLDKTCILDRCRTEEGTVAEAVRETTAAKRNFTVEDVYARA